MPLTNFDFKEKYRYLNGFSSYLESEAVPHTLPIGQNSPQKPPLGLYAEKLSGTSFTAPRHENRQTWLYRVLPSCSHPPFSPLAAPDKDKEAEKLRYIPNQLRWDPFSPSPCASDTDKETDFISGMRLLAASGSPTLKQGLGISVYLASASMPANTAFYSSDGDLLVVPQEGTLDIRTEIGYLLVRPREICLIPRGVRYNVSLPESPARGYCLELWEGQFHLPELGPIGSAGLANERDFQVPMAAFTDGTEAWGDYKIVCKFADKLFATEQGHTPFDIVSWHGRLYPYKYDLGRFNTIGSISYDHPDPSIFTVLTAPSSRAGTAIADFVIFPPRWLVGEETFRPPWYHRNTMAEFMGLIVGGYDAKRAGEGGFQAGGASLHNVMAGHGPDRESYEAGREKKLVPEKVGDGSLAFMFETCLMLGVTEWGLRECRKVQEQYSEHSWGGLKVHWKALPEGEKTEGHLLK